ncbi:YggS family pyridoxal phosphate-dependent enzyme [Hansschlegelia zhihuaiae]|uniref:Pyridoxal phosphate homeostasis protein n=1 Tax=Hansschlegelia zhihuaiae TaxID=405005 RepID=A0A4Q0M7N8_9HYPH|nr:YggS family pyridoxal phosphate-dependent enzyme [Hansschlegelia zhihuaiae]RXF68736.1 YggS family pyridoxal phosphate-dependent enzyme [Hansschlegelia zhihuaiae]
MTADAAARLESVLNAIRRAERQAGRPEGGVELIAVSKTFGAPDIEPVLAAGHRAFGENRVQEAQGKWPALRALHPGVELHLIGPLQSNKAADAVALFDVIHSVDRPKIARALAQEMETQRRRLKVFLQVNVGEEPQKAGVAPGDVDRFVIECRDELGLDVRGLMCIPPIDEPPSPYFALLEKLATRNGLTGLSMGMSADFAEAIAMGATHVRVGSAIFGEREKA